MFDDEDEKYERYVEDYEYGDYDEQDMNRSYSTKRKKSASILEGLTSSSTSSGHVYVQSGNVQQDDDGFEKDSPAGLIIAVTIINALCLLYGFFFGSDIYFWLILYASNMILAAIDLGSKKTHYYVEEKDVVSHCLVERAKNRKKMWFAVLNMLLTFFGPAFLIEYDDNILWVMPLAMFFFIGIFGYFVQCYTYKEKLKAIRENREKNPLKVYVASSWRNEYYSSVVSSLREAGFDVYDFRNPPTGEGGFKWSYIDENYMDWTPEQYRDQLNTNKLAVKQLKNDVEAMKNCDACVLVLPCGRSAHTEAGWFCGAHKKVVVYIPCKQEPELMYGLFYGVATSIEEVISLLI